MAEFSVTVEGKDYDVTAADKATAWRYANATHAKAKARLGQATGSPTAAGGATPTPPISSGPEPVLRPLIAPGAEKLERVLNPPERAFAANMAEGVTSAFTGPALSVKQLAGGKVSDEEIAAERAKTSTGGGMVGNIAANLLTLGVPIGKVVQGVGWAAKFLPKALGIRAGVEGAAVPIAAGVTAPVLNARKSDESIPGQMAESALVAKVFQGVGSLLINSVTKGLITPNKDYKMLAGARVDPKRFNTPGEEGAYMTPGQGAENAFPKTLENIFKHIPFSTSVVKESRNRPLLQGKDILAHRASSADSIQMPLERGVAVNELADQSSAAYNHILAGTVNPATGLPVPKSIPIGTAFRTATLADSKKALVGIKDRSNHEQAFEEELHQMLSEYPIKLSGPQWQELRSRVREKALVEAGGIGDPGEAAKKAAAWNAVDKNLNVLRDQHFTPHEVSVLGNLDRKSIQERILTEGLKDTSEVGGAKTMKNLVKSYEDLTPADIKIRAHPDPVLAARGVLAGHDADIYEPIKRSALLPMEADTLANRAGYGASANTLGSLGLLGLGAFDPASAAVAVAGLGLTRAAAKGYTGQAGSRFLMGNQEWQKKATEALRKMPKVIRDSSPSAALGATTDERPYPY